MKYNINIRETLERVVEAYADSAEEALLIAKAQYDNGETVLDPEDLKETEFYDLGMPEPVQEKKQSADKERFGEIRSNQGYEIIESCTIGNTEIVIGHNPKAPNPYACWYCKGGGNYYWGYYCNTLEAAKEKLNERCQTESHMPYNNRLESHEKNTDRTKGDELTR